MAACEEHPTRIWNTTQWRTPQLEPTCRTGHFSQRFVQTYALNESCILNASFIGRFLIPKSRQPDAPIAQQPYDQPPDSEYFDIANQSNREDSFGQTVGVMETVMTDDTPMREADVETTRPDLEDTSTVPLLISLADVIK